MGDIGTGKCKKFTELMAVTASLELATLSLNTYDNENVAEPKLEPNTNHNESGLNTPEPFTTLMRLP